MTELDFIKKGGRMSACPGAFFSRLEKYLPPPKNEANKDMWGMCGCYITVSRSPWGF